MAPVRSSTVLSRALLLAALFTLASWGAIATVLLAWTPGRSFVASALARVARVSATVPAAVPEAAFAAWDPGVSSRGAVAEADARLLALRAEMATLRARMACARLEHACERRALSRRMLELSARQRDVLREMRDRARENATRARRQGRAERPHVNT